MSVQNEGQPVTEVFGDFTPDDFEFFEPSACWVPPCWINVPLVFRAVSDRAKERFIFPMKLEFQADPFARKSVLQQFSTQFFAIYDQARPAGRQWADALWHQFTALENAFADTSSLFKPPMRFVSRSDFERVPLNEVC